MMPHDTHLHIGSLLFEGSDQIDLSSVSAITPPAENEPR